MPPEKEKELEVKVPAADEPKEVKVDLEKKAVVTPDPAADAVAKQKDADEKERKRQEYLSRKFEQGLKKLDEVLAKIEPKAPEKQEDSKDEIDQLAEKDWKLGVTKLTEKVIEQRESKLREEMEARSREQRLELSRQKVVQRYPNVEDPNAEEGRLYRESMNEMAAEDPSIYQNVYGPVLVMNRMEEKLQSMGKVPNVYRPQVEQEIASETARRQRIGAASLPASRPSGNENYVILSAEEQQICKENGIPFEVYARNKNLTAEQRREGVSVKL